MSEQNPQNKEQNSPSPEQQVPQAEASFVARGIATAVNKYREVRINSLESSIDDIKLEQQLVSETPAVNTNSAKSVLGESHDPELRPITVPERRSAYISERKIRRNMRTAGVNRDLHSTYDFKESLPEIPDSQPEMGDKNKETRALVDERLRRLEQKRKKEAEDKGEPYVPLGQVEGDPYITTTKVELGTPKHAANVEQQRLRKSERRRVDKAAQRSRKYIGDITGNTAAVRALADGIDAPDGEDPRLINKIEKKSDKKQKLQAAVEEQKTLKKLADMESKIKKQAKKLAKKTK